MEISLEKKPLQTDRQNCIVFDVETFAIDPLTNEKIDIKTNFEKYVEYGIVRFVGTYSYKFNEYKQWNLFEEKCTKKTIVPDEKEDVKAYFEEHDVLVGFNSEEFDYPLMFNNGLISDKKFIQIDLMTILGARTFARNDGLQFKDKGSLMGYKFQNNSLKEMGEVMGLDVKKGDFDYNLLYQKELLYSQMWDLMNYLNSDVLLTKEMFEKAWDYFLPFGEFLNEQDQAELVWLKNSMSTIVYKASCKLLNVPAEFGDKVEGKRELGGKVLLPTVEEANYVAVVDFDSLYPHIYTMFNLCSEVGDDVEAAENTLFKTKGRYDDKFHGVLEKDIQEKLRERFRLKKENPDDPMVYAYKIYLNTFYGTQRSEVFTNIHNNNGGYDCCWIGQQMLSFLKKELTSEGFKILAGDTDSLFIDLIDDRHIPPSAYGIIETSYDKLEKALDRIKNKILENVPFPSETFGIKIERILDYVMFPRTLQSVKNDEGKSLKGSDGKVIKQMMAKNKHYLYIADGRIKIKGLPIIKNDATGMGSLFLKEKLIPEIEKRGMAKFPSIELEGWVNEYLAKPEAVELLSKRWVVKPANQYKKPSQIQAQISTAYFNGGGGMISLIKNTKIGRVGKSLKYCSLKEALKEGLRVEDIDLSKFMNEIDAFVLRGDGQ